MSQFSPARTIEAMPDRDEPVNVDLEPEDALRILLTTDLREPPAENGVGAPLEIVPVDEDEPSK